MFSLLRVRKKTSAVIASVCIGALFLWGIASWQDISRAEMLTILLGTVLMLAAIMLAAFILIASIKLVFKAIAGNRESSEASELSSEPSNRSGD